MPNAATDATAFAMAAALSPNDPTLEASRVGIAAIDTEIRRLELRIERLREAKAAMQRRMKSAARA